MLFREDTVARADAEAIRKGVGFYRWTHDLVEITGCETFKFLGDKNDAVYNELWREVKSK